MEKSTYKVVNAKSQQICRGHFKDVLKESNGKIVGVSNNGKMFVILNEQLNSGLLYELNFDYTDHELKVRLF